MVVAVINDNNRVNQSFFRKFKKGKPDAPWIAESPVDGSRPLFLIYDPVHFIKNLRNNWVTEKTKTIQMPVSTESAPFISAIWTHLEELFDQEVKTMVKLSQLTKASVWPSNIDKQKVSLALNVFSEKTRAALKISSSSNPAWKETSLFIDHVFHLWKVFNTQTPVEHIRFGDTDRCPVDLTASGQHQLDYLKFWADCARKMQPGSKRVKSLTRDTASALQWTCLCLVDLCSYLLTTTTALQHQYVAVVFFQQDDLEHHFAHFRMSAGCNYYITAEDVAHIHAMDRAKLMLQTEPDVIHSISQHICQHCKRPLSDPELILLDDLPGLVVKISREEKMSLFFIGGYIASKHTDLKGDIESPVADISAFTDILNRGGLSYPSMELFQLLLYIYCFFTSTSKEQMCRTRLISIVKDFPALFHLKLDLNKTALSRIANIFMKRFCLSAQYEIATHDNNRRKVAKLTSSQ